MSFFSKLRDRLTRSSSKIGAGLDEIVSDGAGEDRFDCVCGLFGVLNVLLGRRSEGYPDDPALLRWEGWVLGQTDQPLAAQPE